MNGLTLLIALTCFIVGCLVTSAVRDAKLNATERAEFDQAADQAEGLTE